MDQRKLLASSALGALRLVFSMLGGALPGLFGIPGASGFINVLIAGGFLALPPLVTKAFWSASIAGTVFSFLALPLPVSGPTGFFPKILIGFSTGLTADVVFWLMHNREKLAGIAMGSAAQTVLGVEFALLGMALQIPGIEKYVELQFSIPGMAATVIGGALSGFIGWLIYSRIKDSNIISRIQGL